MTPGAARVVDVHAHALLGSIDAEVTGRPGFQAVMGLEARRSGPESMAVTRQMVVDRLPRLTDPSVRLADMDAAGITVQVVSPSPSQYHYWADEELALRICRLANAGIAALCATRPDRFTGLGFVPLQHPHLAVEALDHAVGECGLRGVEISSHASRLDGTRAVELSDERLEPFWARAAELGAVVFVHPLGCTLDERLDRWYLANIVGQPVENAVALSHVIFSGVLDRHPDLRLLAAHGGGYLPSYLGRSDHGWSVRSDSRGCAHPPSSYVRRLYFDSLVHSPSVLRSLVELAGSERVLVGSDYPFDMGVTDPVGALLAAGLPDDQVSAIAFGNAAALGLTPTLSP